MSFNPLKRDFSKNQIKILKLLLEKDYLQNELQEALNTTAPNLHYHLSRLERHNLIQKETLYEVGSAKINKISLNSSAREYVRKLFRYRNKRSNRNNPSSYKHPRGDFKKELAPMAIIRKMRKTALLSALLAITFTVLGIIIIRWGMSVG